MIEVQVKTLLHPLRKQQAKYREQLFADAFFDDNYGLSDSKMKIEESRKKYIETLYAHFSEEIELVSEIRTSILETVKVSADTFD